MNKNCEHELQLISFSWNDEDITKKYFCKKCEEQKIVKIPYDSNILKELLYGDNLYKKFNL